MAVLIIAVVVIVAIVIIVKVKQTWKNKSIEGLKSSGGYEVALQIKDALIQAGYEIPEDSKYSIYYYGDNHSAYSFTVKQNSVEVGEVVCHYRGFDFVLSMLHELSMKNKDRRVYVDGYYYAIYNDNIGLWVESKQRTQEVPPFFEIAVKVMLSSRYEFHHPKWMLEHSESRNYLNVMFQ